jgi:ketosteroid isomerase-like protein
MESAQAVSNTTVIQQCYGYFQQGNIPALLNELTDDVKWTSPGPPDLLPTAGVYNGRSGVTEFFKKVAQETEFLAFEPREFIAQNDKVIALGYWEGKSKKTGKVAKNNWAMVFTFRNGKVCNFEEFFDTHNAVEANR